MGFIIKNIGETDVTYEQIVSLMHKSFKGYLDAGIHFTCSSMTSDQLRKNLKDCFVMVAMEPVSSSLLGMYAIRNSRNNRNRLFSYLEYIFISPEAKHSGIGTALMKNVIISSSAAGCDYMLSDTCCCAKEAVDFHLRNGFKKVGITSYKSTDYWSYKFRFQIKKPSMWDCSVYRNFRFLTSFCFVKLTKDIYGNYTKLGVLFNKMICRNFH